MPWQPSQRRRTAVAAIPVPSRTRALTPRRDKSNPSETGPKSPPRPKPRVPFEGILVRSSHHRRRASTWTSSSFEYTYYLELEGVFIDLALERHDRSLLGADGFLLNPV